VTGQDEDIVSIGAPGSPFGLDFVLVPEPKRAKNRLHLDLSPTDRDQDAELQRLLGLGATPADVGQGDDVSWHVLADPEGNEFCLLRGRAGPV
jgi:Glyoxalase-like domain